MRRPVPRHTRRRLLQGSLALAGLGLLAGCGLQPPRAERPARIPRVGYLGSGGGQEGAEAFRQGLTEHGYLEGRTVAVEWRDSEGRIDASQARVQVPHVRAPSGSSE